MGRSIEIRAVNERSRAVLLTAEVTYQGERIVRLVLVGWSLGCASYDTYAEEGEAYDYGQGADYHRIGEYLSFFVGGVGTPEAQAHKQQHEGYGAAVERQVQGIHKEEVYVSGQLRKVGDDKEVEHPEYEYSHRAYAQELFEGIFPVFAFFVVVHENKGRDGEQVEQVYTNGKTHEERNQHYPAHGVWLVGLFVPACHCPEYYGGEEG